MSNKEFVFAALKETSHIPAHCVILERSSLRTFAASVGSSTIMKMVVSSAKSRMFDLNSRTISLIYNRNSSGPKIDPGGTPARMNTQSEVAPGITTPCLLFER